MTIRDETEAYLDGSGTPAQQQLFQDTMDEMIKKYKEKFKMLYEKRPELEPQRKEIETLIAGQLDGAAMLALSNSTLKEMGKNALDARKKAQDEMNRLEGAIFVAKKLGLSITEIERQTGLTRGSIYKRLGMS